MVPQFSSTINTIIFRLKYTSASSAIVRAPLRGLSNQATAIAKKERAIDGFPMEIKTEIRYFIISCYLT